MKHKAVAAALAVVAQDVLTACSSPTGEAAAAPVTVTAAPVTVVQTKTAPTTVTHTAIRRCR